MNTGVPQSVYRINTSQMQQIGLKALSVNESYDFGVGTITFTGWKPWVNLQIVNDPGKSLALIGAILATIGLLMSLFIRQRRIWVKKIEGGIEIAGLSKNEIPGLAEEISELINQSNLSSANLSKNRKLRRQ
jgi:cytochrome c biogenesis protein